jgi:hypothetical protein
MVQYSGQFTQLTDYDPILTEIFYQHYTQELGNGGVMQLFNQIQSTKAKETDLRVGGFSDPVEFNGTIEYTDAERGYEVEYSHTQFASGFLVERQLHDDMQYGNIFQRAQELGTSYARKRRKDAASVFNNAFSTSFNGYDAVPLCEDTHPRSRTDSTAVDNELTLTLSTDNLETAITTMQGFGDDLGEEITIMPNVLVVPRNLRKTALEIAGSENQPENANNAINVHQGISVLVDPYLTDSNAWFVVDTSMSRRYLKWFNRVMPEFKAADDFDTFVRKYAGYMRYSYGWSDFRWIIGSNPS